MYHPDLSNIRLILGLPSWLRWVRSLGQEDPLEEGMATHSSILPGESQGLVGYRPYVHKESDATKHARALFYLIQMKEKKERRKERETERRVTRKRVTSKRKRVTRKSRKSHLDLLCRSSRHPDVWCV